MIKKKLKDGLASVGSWVQLNSPDIAEILAASGSFDWVAIDMEHGCISPSDLPNFFRAIELYDCLPLVRLQQKTSKSVKDVMDCGAKGIIIPTVESSEEISDLVKQALYPPYGNRGIGNCRSNVYGLRFDEHLDQDPLVVGIIETKEGLDNIDEISKCSHLDAIMIGPYDLSGSLGIVGEFDNYIFVDAVNKIKDVCKKNMMPMGIHILKPDPSLISKEINSGSQFIAYSADCIVLCEFAKCLE